MSKIFLFSVPMKDPEYVQLRMGYALAEDGSFLFGTGWDPEVYIRATLNNLHARACYQEHYPDGYTIVDLLDLDDDQLMIHESFMAAWKINHSLGTESLAPDF